MEVVQKKLAPPGGSWSRGGSLKKFFLRAPRDGYLIGSSSVSVSSVAVAVSLVAVSVSVSLVAVAVSVSLVAVAVSVSLVAVSVIVVHR